MKDAYPSTKERVPCVAVSIVLLCSYKTWSIKIEDMCRLKVFKHEYLRVNGCPS